MVSLQTSLDNLVAPEQFNKMHTAASLAGHKLRNVGDYRSFQGQLSMFMDRYTTTDQGRSPQVTRQYEGKTWYLKPGKAPSAAPDPTGLKGSNHGWGLAIDLGYDEGGKVKSFALNSPSFLWICENAPEYGFYLLIRAYPQFALREITLAILLF